MIHHLSWAVVAVAWVMAVGDPLTMIPSRESSPQDPFMGTRGEELSEQRISNAIGDSPWSAVRATSFHSGPGQAGKTEVNALDPPDGRRLNIEETFEFIERMERVPLSAAERQDLGKVLKFR